jgi:MFS family permease
MLRSYVNLLVNNRNYRLLWIAQLVSELGDWFYTLAVYGLLLELTGNSAQSVALAVVLQVLPHTLAAPASGVINDRISRKTIMIASDVARFFVVLGMLAVRTPGTVWLVYPLLLLETLGAALNEPAHSASIPAIVPEAEVLPANTLASITWSFCLAAGASLGGVTAVLLGRDAVFLLNAVSFLVSAWLIRRMRFEEPHTEGLEPLRARDLFDFSPVMEGIRYIRADRRLLATVFVKGGIGLLGANNVLLPILGQREFAHAFPGIDPARGATLGMSFLMGARGAGSLIGPLLAGKLAGDRHHRLRWGILAGFVLSAVSYLLLGGVASLVVAVAAVVAAHAGVSTNWVFSTTLLQHYTEDRLDRKSVV